MDELKRCPCCKGEARMYFVSANGLHISDFECVRFGQLLDHRQIRCEKCGLQTKVYKTAKGAFNAWNRRPE